MAQVFTLAHEPAHILISDPGGVTGCHVRRTVVPAPHRVRALAPLVDEVREIAW